MADYTLSRRIRLPSRLLLAAEPGRRRGTRGPGVDNDQIKDHLRDHEYSCRMAGEGSVPITLFSRFGRLVVKSAHRLQLGLAQSLGADVGEQDVAWSPRCRFVCSGRTRQRVWGGGQPGALVRASATCSGADSPHIRREAATRSPGPATRSPSWS